uniref:Uncharacterized protein n=1 Tax=Phage sp. ctcqm2 TaxID=2828007 RepID=A0A8S5SUA4_9VIRU|nr:MAG TPA: hypothetical protein [Phage sp. ctcqm2]
MGYVGPAAPAPGGRADIADSPSGCHLLRFKHSSAAKPCPRAIRGTVRPM